MNKVIYVFENLSVWIRAAILLFFVILLWKMCGKIILWVLSIIPFLIRNIFRLFFVILELPVAGFHKIFGSILYDVDNSLSAAGEKIDSMLEHWYTAWHSCERINFGKCFLVYVVCVVFVALPSFVKWDNQIVKKGELLYIQAETFALNALKKLDGDVEDTIVSVEDVQEQLADNEDLEKVYEEEQLEEILIVSGINDNSSLLVRDIPSNENSVKIENLKNGDKVIWQGHMVFSEIDGQLEPWVYVITENGNEGWSRLLFLQPQYDLDVKCRLVTE